MSTLTPPPQDISPHPAKGSVTAPLDPQTKNADADRKIRLYGAVDALRHGKLPSNAQIESFLTSIADAHPPAMEGLSREGKRLVEDAKQVVRTTREMVREKNADELLQGFVWHTRRVEKESLKGGIEVGPEGRRCRRIGTKVCIHPSRYAPYIRITHDRDPPTAVKHLRTIVTLVLTNAEVRKLLADVATIGRDLLARGAAQAAGALAPAPEALQRVNESAPNDQFVTAGGRTAGPGETPVLEARVPGLGGAHMHPREDEPRVWREGQNGEQGEKRPVGEVADRVGEKGGVREQAGAVREQAEGAKEQAQDAAVQGMREVHEAQDAGDEQAVEEKKRGVMGKMKQLRDNINDRIPQQHKDAAHDKLERGKKFFTEEYFPEERRDQFIFRGKKVILECQKHDDYQESIRWLLSFIEEYAAHGRDAAGQGKEHVSGLTDDETLNLCIRELRTLLERFANNMSMDVIIDAVNALVDDARRDEGLRRWWTDVDAYVHKVLLEPGYVLEPDCNTQANKLRESGRVFFQDKYKDHFNNLFSSIGKWFGAMGEDPINRQLGEDWARLTKHLLFDSEGSLKFKPELWNDVRKVIFPSLVDQIGYIPIPRIEYTDDSLDLVVENLTLSGRNLLPNIVELEAHNFVRFSPYSAIQDDHRHRVRVGFEQMQADMRDVKFYYRKKTGLARVRDAGVADVVLGGQGVSATIELISARHDPSSVFTIHSIHVKIDSLKFAIRDSNHDFLYKTLRPLATGLIKKQVGKAVRDALRTGLEYLDGELVAVRERIFTRTKEKEKDASIRTKASGRSQFKIVADPRDSLLAGAGHPAGWVHRTAEVQAKAREGTAEAAAPGAGAAGVKGGVQEKKGGAVGMEGKEEGWRSDAFDLGAAEPGRKFGATAVN
ncbi:hypothetical protein BJ912DRAFT_1032111 [Pholiota molesta]|nr:hypothetical protein BJ912DRAFT_1032111 [Pholiota molesta]